MKPSTRVIDRLLAAAEAVGAGNLSARVGDRCSGGEFGRLARALAMIRSTCSRSAA